MNSKDKDFDRHKSGIWAAIGPDGTPEYETMAASPYSCRASLIGCRNRRWSALEEDGWVIQEYVPAIPVLTDVIKVGDQVAVGAVARWQYPHIGEHAPAGVVVQLLTQGGVAVRGVWNDLGDYIAWAPMLKRDKEIERRLEP